MASSSIKRSLFIGLSLIGLSCGKDGTKPWIACKLSSTWTSTGAYQVVSQKDTFVLSIGSDKSGMLYGAGKSVDASGFGRWFIRKSSDGGASWSSSDDFQYAENKTSLAYAIEGVSGGSVYSAGEGIDAATTAHWIVRKSSDKGSSWSTVDDHQSSVGRARALAVGETLSGYVLVGGFVNDASNIGHWIIRRSIDGGSSWATVDDYQSIADARVKGILKNPKGASIAVGYGTDAGGVLTWIVRRSANDGQTWTTVDSYQLTSGENAEASSVVADAEGNIYVAGSANDTANSRFVIRKSTDDGLNWSTIFTHEAPTDLDTFGTAIAVDVFGGIIAAGYYADGSAKNHGLIYRSKNFGESFSALDDFQAVSGQSSQYNTIRGHGSGPLVATGLFTDAVGTSTFIVRRLGCE